MTEFAEKQALGKFKISIISKNKTFNLENRSDIYQNRRSKKIKIPKAIINLTRYRDGEDIIILDLDPFLPNPNFSTFVDIGVTLILKFKNIVEDIAVILKEGELKSTGLSISFFKLATFLLKFGLHNANIAINYSLIKRGMKTQVIMTIISVGGTLGMVLFWINF